MAQDDNTTIALSVVNRPANSQDKTGTRIDKNIINNILDLRVFGNDEPYIKCLIFYFAWKNQTGLFDLCTLDPDEFCTLFKLKKTNLFAKHPNAKHREQLSASNLLLEYEAEYEKNPSNTSYRIYDTILENALFRLMKENLIFSGETRQYVDENGNYNVEYPLKQIVFLSELTARHIMSKKGQKKIVYDYKLNESFKKNLSLFFSPIDLNAFAQLRQPNAENLYIFLKSLRDTLKSQGTNSTSSVSFEKLCSVADIFIKSPKLRKQKLIAKFNILQNKIGFPVELTWTISPGHRWAYIPVIIFPDVNFDPKTKTEEQKGRILQRQDILFTNFMQECSSIIVEKWSEKKREADFPSVVLKFLQHQGFFEDKEIAFRQAQARSFQTPSTTLLNQSQQIVSRLTQVKTLEDVKLVIMGKIL